MGDRPQFVVPSPKTWLCHQFFIHNHDPSEDVWNRWARALEAHPDDIKSTLVKHKQKVDSGSVKPISIWTAPSSLWLANRKDVWRFNIYLNRKRREELEYEDEDEDEGQTSDDDIEVTSKKRRKVDDRASKKRRRNSDDAGSKSKKGKKAVSEEVEVDIPRKKQSAPRKRKKMKPKWSSGNLDAWLKHRKKKWRQHIKWLKNPKQHEIKQRKKKAQKLKKTAKKAATHKKDPTKKNKTEEVKKKGKKSPSTPSTAAPDNYKKKSKDGEAGVASPTTKQRKPPAKKAKGNTRRTPVKAKKSTLAVVKRVRHLRVGSKSWLKNRKPKWRKLRKIFKQKREDESGSLDVDFVKTAFAEAIKKVVSHKIGSKAWLNNRKQKWRELREHFKTVGIHRFAQELFTRQKFITTILSKLSKDDIRNIFRALKDEKKRLQKLSDAGNRYTLQSVRDCMILFDEESLSSKK